MQTIEEIRDRVNLGLTWLKEEGPKYGCDLARVNVDNLDIKHPNRCALGQSSGMNMYTFVEDLRKEDYVRGLTGSVDRDWEKDHGFWHTGDGDERDGSPAGFCCTVEWELAVLTDVWREAIIRDRENAELAARFATQDETHLDAINELAELL